MDVYNFNGDCVQVTSTLSHNQAENFEANHVSTNRCGVNGLTVTFTTDVTLHAFFSELSAGYCLRNIGSIILADEFSDFSNCSAGSIYVTGSGANPVATAGMRLSNANVTSNGPSAGGPSAHGGIVVQGYDSTNAICYVASLQLQNVAIIPGAGNPNGLLDAIHLEDVGSGIGGSTDINHTFILSSGGATPYRYGLYSKFINCGGQSISFTDNFFSPLSSYGSGFMSLNNSEVFLRDNAFNGVFGLTDASFPTAGVMPGSRMYCTDCKNVANDSATAGMACTGTGFHGAPATFEFGQWNCN